MKKVKMSFDNELTKEELRLISFSSEYIKKYEINANILNLYVSDNADISEIKNNIFKLLKNIGKEKNDKIIYKSAVNISKYTSDKEITASGIIEAYGQGSIELNELGIKLFKFFDESFMKMISDLNPIMKSFPTLLPCKTINDTNYLTSSPQYVLFCSKVEESLDKIELLQDKYDRKEVDDCLNYPEVVLSPSACFPLYEKLRHKKIDGNKIYTMLQNVFRNEGRFNWTELTRLQDYYVREIVMIGDHDFILETRKEILDKTIKFMNDLKIQYSVQVAADPFVVPRMRKYKLIQKFNEVKYEVKLNIMPNDTISCASYNLHGTSFSGKFKFETNNIPVTESGCVGFGIERWIIAFLAQHGLDIDNWPIMVRDYIS